MNLYPMDLRNMKTRMEMKVMKRPDILPKWMMTPLLLPPRTLVIIWRLGQLKVVFLFSGWFRVLNMSVL